MKLVVCYIYKQSFRQIFTFKYQIRLLSYFKILLTISNNFFIILSLLSWALVDQPNNKKSDWPTGNSPEFLYGQSVTAQKMYFPNFQKLTNEVNTDFSDLHKVVHLRVDSGPYEKNLSYLSTWRFFPTFFLLLLLLSN